MNKFIKLCAVFMLTVMLIAFAIAAMAEDTALLTTAPAEETVDHIMYTAADIKASYKTEGVSVGYIKAVDNDPEYIHIISPQSKSSAFRFDPVKTDVPDNEYKPAFKFLDYPVVVVKYRTNIVAQDKMVGLNGGILLTTGAYERTWGLKPTIVANETWRKLICDISTFRNHLGWEPVSTSIKDVMPESGVRYVRLPLWSYSANPNFKSEYFDIQYIAFFKNVTDAENFEGKDPEVKSFTIIILDKDGKNFKKCLRRKCNGSFTP